MEQATGVVFILCILATAAVVWAWREVRRDPGRFPITGGLDLGGVLVALVPMAAVGLGAYFVASNEVFPRNAPIWFVLFLALTSIAAVASMVALSTIYTRRRAIGWLTVLDPERMHVRLGEIDEEIALGQSAVEALAVHGKPQYLQFNLPLARGTLCLIVMVPARDLKLATPGKVVEPGAPVLAAGRQFVDAVRPYVGDGSAA